MYCGVGSGGSRSGEGGNVSVGQLETDCIIFSRDGNKKQRRRLTTPEKGAGGWGLWSLIKFLLFGYVFLYDS